MEGLCSQTEARWFYAFYSKVYERLQPYFTSSEMREAGLDLAAVAAGMDVLDVGAGTGTLSMQVVGRGVSPDRLTLIDQAALFSDFATLKWTDAYAAGRYVRACAQKIFGFHISPPAP